MKIKKLLVILCVALGVLQWLAYPASARLVLNPLLPSFGSDWSSENREYDRSCSDMLQHDAPEARFEVEQVSERSDPSKPSVWFYTNQVKLNALLSLADRGYTLDGYEWKISKNSYSNPRAVWEATKGSWESSTNLNYVFLPMKNAWLQQYTVDTGSGNYVVRLKVVDNLGCAKVASGWFYMHPPGERDRRRDY